MDQLVQMFGQFASNHPYWVLGAIVGYWLLSNVASALPSPSQASSGIYKFTFSLIHGLVGSIPRLVPSLRLPGDPSRTSPTFYGNGGSQPNTPPPPTTPVH